MNNFKKLLYYVDSAIFTDEALKNESNSFTFREYLGRWDKAIFYRTKVVPFIERCKNMGLPPVRWQDLDYYPGFYLAKFEIKSEIGFKYRVAIRLYCSNHYLDITDQDKPHSVPFNYTVINSYYGFKMAKALEACGYVNITGYNDSDEEGKHPLVGVTDRVDDLMNDPKYRLPETL